MKSIGMGLAASTRVAIYARASTAGQEDSIDVQIAAAKEYIASMGWTLVTIYVDEALSRAEYVKRPQLLKMLIDADDSKFDVLVMRDLDRLGGDLHRTGIILSDLTDVGVAVHEYKPGGARPVKLDDATSKFIVAAKNFASELEREKTSQRTLEDHTWRVQQGWVAGGICIGYKNVPVLNPDGTKNHTESAIDQVSAAIVVEIWRRHWVEGESYRSIAHDFNARRIPAPVVGERGSGHWSARFIHDISKNERYLGANVWGRTKKTYRKGTKVRVNREPNEVLRNDAPHLRIIPEEIERAYQERRRKPKPGMNKQGRKAQHLLTGIARCGLCRGSMQAKRVRGTHVYFCAKHNECGSTVCPNSLRRSVDEADRVVIGAISRELDEDLIVATLKAVRKKVKQRSVASNGEIERIEADLPKLRAELDKLAEAIALTGGTVDVLAKKLAGRQAKLFGLQTRLQLLRSAPDVVSLEVRRLEKEVRARIGSLRDLLHGQTEHARRALHSLLENGLTFTPRETDTGREYRIEGRIVLGALLQTEANLSGTEMVRKDQRPQGDSNPC